MKHILMQTPNSFDGVARYRHWGPMFEIQKQGLVSLHAMTDDTKRISDWHYYRQNHLAFLSRGAQLTDLAIVEECLAEGLPMWLDMDDNLFLVPDTSDGYYYYSNPKTLDNLKTILKAVNVVTVATKPLQAYLKKELKLDTVLIPNALEDHLLRFKQNFNYNNKVVWRGSGGGKESIDYYAPAILDIVQEFKRMTFGFFGFNPYQISRRSGTKNIMWEKAQNFPWYIKGLTSWNPSFSFLTHLNTEFDRTKSTNGWLESTLAGAVCLVPDIGDWSDIPSNMVFKYKCMDLQDFKDKFTQMLGTEQSKLKEMHINSMNYIENNLLLSIINKKRVEIINEYGQKSG